MIPNNPALNDTIQGHYQEQLLKITKDSIDDIHRALVEEPDSNPPPLPERIFVGYFLPYFTNQKSLAENPKVYPDWLSVAGSPVGKVRIIDDQGETLYVVPGLMNSGILNTKNHNPRTSFAEMNATMDLVQATGIPGEMEQFIAQAFDAKAHELVAQASPLSEDEAAWQAIFERYQIKPSTAPTATSGEGSIPGDEFDYD
jgi:hypothetical protein